MAGQTRSSGFPFSEIGLLGEIGAALNGLPGVFSTVQWGGRAYKVPGPSGRSKAKLLAFVSTDDAGRDAFVSFKLKPPRAREVVDRHDWIEPHSFRTLAPSGWLTARVRTRRQLAILANLLHESRALYAPAADTDPKPPRPDDPARHIDRVMTGLRASGWSPPQD